LTSVVEDLLSVKQGEQYDTKEVKHVFKMLNFWNKHNFSPADPLTEHFFQEAAGYKVVSGHTGHRARDHRQDCQGKRVSPTKRTQ
jgi:hypothetical protein